jgi:hypothetical protein
VKTRLALSLLIAFFTIPAAAEAPQKMDLTDHNAVIEKLEVVVPNLTDDPAKLNLIQIRLADLYAERARILEVNAGEKDCTTCKDFVNDRKKAIALYEKAVMKAPLDSQKKSYLQLGHLYMATRQDKKAAALFKNITNDKKLRSIHPKAYLGLADIQFANQQFETSLKTFNKAEKNAAKDDQSYITYRKAWAQLNIGNNKTALNLVQKAVRQASAPEQASFRRDLMRDYATILAKNDFGTAQVNTFAQFSPEADRAENLKYLGEEADRLGNKRGALLIWSQYSAQDEKTKDTAEFNIRMALNYYDLNQPDTSLKFLDKTVKAISNEKCEDCKKVASTFRSFLVNWNKKEKSEPSKQLTQAYSLYFVAAPDDFEALIWAAQIAQQQNNSVVAYGFYERAAIVAHKNGKKAETEKFASIAMEVADSTKSDKLKEQSLHLYLDLCPQGPKRFLAQYQLAYIAYKQKKYETAASEFKRLALEKEWNDTGIKIQAADLNLDILATLKKDREIRSNAIEFAKAFKTKVAHFTEISRKVTMNILVKLVTQPDGSRSEIRSEIDILKSYSIAHLSNQEKLTQYKNIALAAEKISDIGTVQAVSNQILKAPGATADDIEFANKSLLWVAELQLDFKKAYQIAGRMKMSGQTVAQKQLRLGLLAELAGLNPEPHFNQYIRASGVSKKSNELRVKMIRRSGNKWAKLNEMMRHLRATPEVLASITLELHLAQKNDRVVNQVLNVRGVSRTAEGQYLLKLKKREEATAFVAQVSRAKIDMRNDRTVGRSMKQKIALLEQLKRQYDIALRVGDLPLQARILSSIETENRRFYSQIQRLPIPRGLRAQERVTYKNLINQQSEPFKLIADEAKTNLAKLINDNDKAMDELEKALRSSDTLQRRLAMSELRALRPYMTRSQISSFESTVSDMQVSSNKVEKIRREVRINPLNTSVLAELRELEARRANGPLIAYLDQRIEQLKNESRR